MNPPNYTVMKAGPTPVEEFDQDKTETRVLLKIANRLALSPITASVTVNQASETYLRSAYNFMQIKKADQLQLETQALYSKFTISCSAHNIQSRYVKSNTGIPEQFSFGNHSTLAQFAIEIGNVLSGSKEDGNHRKTYNSQEMTQATNSMAHAVGLRTHINQTALWLKIWHSLLMYRVATWATNTANCTAEWVARPNDPHQVVNIAMGLNLYEDHLADIMSGDRLILELCTSETDLIPVLIFLIGVRNSNLAIRTGANNGNNRVPCIMNYQPPEFGYDIIVSTRNAVNLDLGDEPEMAGLPAGAIADNPNFGVFEEGKITRALNVLARMFPHLDGIESGLMIAVTTAFGEPFNGVTEVAGSEARKATYNCYLHAGDVPVPSGSLITSLATSTRAKTSYAQEAVNLVSNLAGICKSLDKARRACEVIAMTIQLASRQFGITAEIFTPSNDYLIEDHRRPESSEHATASQIRTMHMVPMGNVEPNLGQMILKFSQVLYDAEMPSNGVCVTFGHTEAHVGPYHSVANQGECLNSVHPAQILDGIFAVGAEGIAGVTANMKGMLEELKFQSNLPRPQVVKQSGIVETESVIEHGGVVGGLGHGMMLINGSASGDDDDDETRVAVMGQSFGDFSSVVESTKYLDIDSRYAFATNQQCGVPAVGVRVACRQIMLFADYDIIASMVYQMALPSCPASSQFMHNKHVRLSNSGYVDMAVAGAASRVTNYAFGIGQHTMGRIKRKASRIMIGEDSKQAKK